LQDVNLAAIHAGRVTIKYKDLAFVKSIPHEDKLFNPSTPGGVDKTHERQAKKRIKNTAGLDALRQLERGRGNRRRSTDGDPGPIWLSQGSVRHGGKPTGVARGTTPLSSKPDQEVVHASLASGVVTAVKPRSNSSTNKNDKQEKSKQEKKKRLFSRK
jgi:hypothetical protein